jgi:hypothetical protein
MAACTLTSGATLNGAALSLNAAITLTSANVFLPGPATHYLSVPNYASGASSSDSGSSSSSTDTIASGPSVGIAVAAMVGVALIVTLLIICFVLVCNTCMCCAPAVSFCCCGRAKGLSRAPHLSNIHPPSGPQSSSGTALEVNA